MIAFKNVPLRRKLTWLAMLCSLAALITMAASLAAYEWFIFRKSIVAQMTTLASVTANNSSAALAFSDLEDATRILAALEAEPTIVTATLYDERGRKFAGYLRRGRQASTPMLAPEEGLVLAGTRLELAVPVAEAKRFGTLLVYADLEIISDRLSAYLVVLVGTAAIAGLLAFLLGGWLANRIAAPVQALAAAAAGVKTTADYGVRVPKKEEDELGALTDAFNAMFARVQRNEADLDRSAERLRLALESARIGLWDWDIARDNVTWSQRNYEIFGLAPGTPVNAGVFFEQVHPEDRLRVKAAVEASAQTSSDFAVEFRIVRPERPVHYVAARGRFLKATGDTPARAVGVTIDITDRRGSELRMMESELRFRAVAERAPAMIWSCDQSLQRDYFNKTWLIFTGRSLEAELGTGWQHTLPDEDVVRWQEAVSAAAAELDPYTIEYRLRRADGELRWVIETGSPRVAADGSFAGYFGSCIDITARKENEAELEDRVQRRTRELELVNQELESFSYSVSHDLRGPVRAIQGFSEIALEECRAGNPDAAIERLQRVIRAAERMNRLIDAFIGMARISRAELRIETVDLSSMAEEVVGFLRSTAPQRQVEIAIAPGIECHGDGRLLRIVLENLLGNAWKFTARTERARIEFESLPRETGRWFVVRDNGAGFNGALAHKLFRAFERLHSVSQFEGLGVGLNTVHRIVEKHGGRVWAEAEEGKGAAFYFTLPARAVVEKAATERKAGV